MKFQNILRKKEVKRSLSLFILCATSFTGKVWAEINPAGLLINTLPAPENTNFILPEKKKSSAAESINLSKSGETGSIASFPHILRITGFESSLSNDVEGYRIVSKYFPLQITSVDWKRISDEIWREYSKLGKLVRVDLVLSDHKVIVSVSQLNIRKVRILGAGTYEKDVERVRSLVHEYIQEGQPVDLKEIQQFLSRIDYRANEKITTNILSDNGDGIDITFIVSPHQTFVTHPWSIGGDNYGVYSFGRYRAGASYSGPLFSPGDNLGIQTVYSRGLIFGSGRYDFPLPLFSKLRGSIWSSALHYSVKNEVQQRGHAVLGGIDLSYPTFFWGGVKLISSISYEHKYGKDTVLSMDTTQKNIDNVHFRMRAQGLLSNRLELSGDLTLGNLSLNGARALAQDDYTARTNGSFQKFNWNINFIQAISLNSFLSSNIKGQFAAQNLDSLEKFSFGGNGGVKGYDNDITNGDEGALANISYFYQIRHPIFPTRLGVFYDYAIGRINHSPWEGASETANTFHLSSTGLQAELNYRNVILNMTVAHPLGKSALVPDQKWRVWVGLKASF